MKSIYGKLICGFLLSLLFSFSITGYFTIKQNTGELYQLSIKELQDSTEHVSDLIALINTASLDNAKILNDTAETSEVSFRIYTDQATYTYGHFLDHLSLTEEEQTQLSIYNNHTIVKTKGSYNQYSKSYIIHNQKYTISVQKDNSSRDSIFANSALLAIICMSLAGSFIFLLVADIIVKPISKLTKATNELSKGNYKVRVNYAGNDEISRLNRSFNQMAQQLAKAEETRQQFISDISHEFQTPLTAIQGFATILKNEDLPVEQRKKYADIILFHTKRLSTLSKNMLQLTLLEGEDTQLDYTKFSLIEQLARVISLQDEFALSKDIEIEFIKPKSDIMIEADESRLEQVWINLVNNAVKYTNEHGLVTVEIKRTTKDIEVKIEDTGVGMSSEAISHIFERFYRQEKSRSVEGNGLGLSIVKTIIDLHHYTIDVTSQEDGGSIFTVKIPDDRFKIVSKLNKGKKVS